MASRVSAKVPTRDLEQSLHDAGHRIIVGVDEVGKGAWAGPLAVGMAILPLTGDLAGVRDSKSITEKSREAMFDTVASWPMTASPDPTSMYGNVSEIDSSSRMSASHCTWLLQP